MPAVFAVLAVVACCALAPRPAQAQPALDRFAADLREEVRRIDVTAKDLYGREQAGTIALTMFRPAGPGPFPLAIVSHGRGSAAQRAAQGRQRFEPLARYLVSKGFAVFVPTRLGYGDTAAIGFDPEDSGTCQAKRFEPMAAAASAQVLAALAHARAQPWVDARRWVALGQSVGGLTTLAVAGLRPPGLVAAINFSGGAGGDPERRPADPCGPDVLASLWRAQAAGSEVPTLWIYWTHDRYWGEQQPRRWAEAWREGGGRVQLHQLGPWSDEPADGHTGLFRDMDRWVPLVEAFLAAAGFATSGVVPRPPATAFARIDELDKVPVSEDRRALLYRAFLASKAPRAFAIGPSGIAAWASGDWALGRALGGCQWRTGQACRFYAVDDDVVWVPF
ncbi:MAG: hypothetical protein KIT17_20960 [Rubrivivax sp.]|nr:hypothetical protein [Rubrivivax sp.]